MRNHLMAIGFTIAFAAPSMAGVSPSDVVKKYCELDQSGARLTSKRWKEQAALITWPDEPGWDHATIIDGFRIESEDVKGDRASVRVLYRIAEPKPRTETVAFKLVRSGKTWKITEPSIEPHVSKAALNALSGGTEELTCKAEKRFSSGGSEEHELTLKIKGGRVTELAYSNSMSNGQEGGGYLCDLNLTEGSPDLQWVRSGRKTRVTENNPDRDSYVEIDRLANGDYEVNFENVAVMPHCGFGSEFPDSILLKRSSRKCAVRH